MNQKNKRRLNLVTKLVILYIIVMSLIFLTQIFYIVPFIKNEKLESIKSYQEEIAQNISSIIDNKNLEFKEELLNMADLPEFSNMDIEAQTPILVNYKNIIKGVYNYFVLDSEAWYVSSSLEDLSPWQTQSHPEDPSFNISFIKGKTYYSTPVYFKSVGEINYYISVPILSETGERIGVLIGIILLNDLIEMIYKHDLQEGTHITLVDNEGTVVASSGIDLYVLEDGPLSLDHSEHPDVQAVLEGNTGSFEHEYEGLINYSSTSIVESNGWGVIVRTPTVVLHAEVNKIERFLWLINTILFIVPLIILIVYSRQIDLERTRSEKMVQRQSEELKDSREKKLAVLGQLAGGVAHDLRNPLGAIKNGIYFLNMAIKKPQTDIKKTLGILDKAIIKSENIISNILNFGRPGTSIKKNINIGNILQDIITQTDIPDNIKVLNKLDKSIPAVFADPGQTIQIFSNIILNAVQAMPEGGKLTVKYAIIDKKWLDISVSDTGIGIPAENMDKIFDPMFTSKAKGIGLGLALIKILVDANGGKISVNSKVGEGTAFTLKLPTRRNR